MPAIVRVGDPISCGDRMGQGSPNVFANNISVSRTGVDKTRGHCFAPVPMIQGSPSVFANNLPINGVGGAIPVHACGSKRHAGRAVSGSPNVFIDSPDGGVVETPVNTEAVIVEDVDQYRNDSESAATPFAFAFTITDDHEAPNVGATGPAAITYRDKVIQTEGPPPIAKEDAIAPPINPPTFILPTDCSDIESHIGAFPPSFPLSPNYTVGSLTNARISKYPLRANAGLTEKQIVCNMRMLCINVLEPLRNIYGASMVINSGFRTNGGKSQHEKGQAVDIAFPLIETDDDAMFVRAQQVISTVTFDQFIFEKAKTYWLHLSFAMPPNAARQNKILTLVYGTTTRYIPGIVKTV